MEGLGGLFLRMLAISAGCSAVVGPLLLLAPRMRKRVAARTFYILFLLLALRLTLPFEVKLPAPAVRVQVPAEVTVAAPRPAEPAQSAQVSADQFQAPAVQSPAAEGGQTAHTPAVPSQAAQPAPEARSIPLPQLAGTVWAAGMAACVLWAAGSFLLARRRLLRGARRAGEGERAVLERLRQELGVGRPVRLYRSGDTATPLAMGLFRPAVVLPAEGCAGAALSLVLRHELTHIRRWDVAYKLVLSLACAVNWFNPLVWLMDRAAGRNLELCCDDDVARGLSEAGRKEYGRVLLSAAGAGRPLPFTTCFSGGKEQMTVRLLNLFTKKKNSAALVCLVLAAALLAGGLVACESAGAGDAPPEKADGEIPSERVDGETPPEKADGEIPSERVDGETPPEAVAESYLETVARRMYLYEEESELKYTAYWGGITAVVSYIPSRNFELLDGRVYSLDEVQSRLRYMDDAVNCLKYRWMAEDIWREDVSIGYTVERVDVDGDYAAVDIRESVGFRYRGLTAPSGMEDKYRVDLVRCDGTWFVVDVNQTGKDPLWCDSKDEESFLALTGLPHDLNWFGNAINDDRTRPEWAQFLTGEELNNLPVYCVAGWPDPQAESGEVRVKLLYSPVGEDDYQVTVRVEADDSLTLLDAGKFPLRAG